MLRRSVPLLLLPGEQFLYKVTVPAKISSALLHSQKDAPPHPFLPKYKWKAEKAPTEEERREVPNTITLYGGSGFLGRRVTELLVQNPDIRTIRIGTRFPEEFEKTIPEDWRSKVKAEFMDITDRHNVLALAEGSQALVNLVGISYERELSFREAHIDSAHLIAHAANVVWATRFVQISSLVAEHEALSAWAESRFRGEDAAIANFRHATILRCAPMFGKDSPQLSKFRRLVGKLPFYPAFGSNYKVAPVWVGDVAQAVVYSITDQSARGLTVECTGPEIFTHADLARKVLALAGPARPVVPVPKAWWGLWAASIRQWLPDPTFTLDHIYTLWQGRPSTETGNLNTLENLGIQPRKLADTIDK